MGKKRAFLDKKNAERFRLVPKNGLEKDAEKVTPTQTQLDEQHKCGIFFDDDYDYLKHLKDRNEQSVLLPLGEPVVLAAPRQEQPLPMLYSHKKTVVFDEEIDQALDGDPQFEGPLPDDFVTVAGGVLDDSILVPRRNLDEFSEDEDDIIDDYSEDEDEEEEESGWREEGKEDGRDIDKAFNCLLHEYDEDVQFEEEMNEHFGPGLEPTDRQMMRLVYGQKGAAPEYDAEWARKDALRRAAVIMARKEDEEKVQVEESGKKRLKWDCESFVTTNSTLYNHPALIKEAKKTKQQIVKEEGESDEEMDEDGDSEGQTLPSNYRDKNETPEERKARKQAVKAHRRMRRVEKKENKRVFADARKRTMDTRVGRINTFAVV